MELGISSPLTQTGPCKGLKGWLVDTATIYRIGINRTGVAMMILAAGSITVGITIMALNKANAWAGIGLWTGLPMFASGVVSVVLKNKRPGSKLSPLSTVCLIAFLASCISMVTSVISLIYYDKLYPDYIRDISTDFLPLHVLNGILVALSPSQTLFSLWALFISTGYVCPCLRPARSNIFTIMVEADGPCIDQ